MWSFLCGVFAAVSFFLMKCFEEDNYSISNIFLIAMIVFIILSLVFLNRDLNKKEYEKNNPIKTDDELRYERITGKSYDSVVVPPRKIEIPEEPEEEYLPKCPTCGCPDVHRIGLGNKVASGVAFGVFALGHINKSFKCDNCGYKW